MKIIENFGFQLTCLICFIQNFDVEIFKTQMEIENLINKEVQLFFQLPSVSSHFTSFQKNEKMTTII